jgi:hypothetical protein
MRPDGRLMVSVMMLVIFVFFVGQALTFRADARAMPLLIGIPAIVLCLLQIALDLRRGRGAIVQTALLIAEERPIVLWILAFFFAIIAFGFAYGAPPLVAVYLYFAARERPVVAIAGGLFCVVVLSFLFERLLQIQLFEGLVTGLFI